MSKDDLTKDLEKMARNSAITLKSSSSVKISSATKKDIKFLEKLIAKQEQELASLNFKKDDLASKAEEMHKRLEAARDVRDEKNKLIPALREKKNTLEKRKQELLDKKRTLGEQIGVEADTKKKKSMWDELQIVKKELNQIFEDLNPAWEEYKEARRISDEEHTNMRVYYQLSSQSRKEVDDIFKDIKKLKKKLYNNRKKLRNLKYQQ